LEWRSMRSRRADATFAETHPPPARRIGSVRPLARSPSASIAFDRSRAARRAVSTRGATRPALAAVPPAPGLDGPCWAPGVRGPLRAGRREAPADAFHSPNRPYFPPPVERDARRRRASKWTDAINAPGRRWVCLREGGVRSLRSHRSPLQAFHERVHPRQAPWRRIREMRSGPAGFHSHSVRLARGGCRLGSVRRGAAISVSDSRSEASSQSPTPGGGSFLAGSLPRLVRLSGGVQAAASLVFRSGS
jgi:hypothetical protein